MIRSRAGANAEVAITSRPELSIAGRRSVLERLGLRHPATNPHQELIDKNYRLQTGQQIPRRGSSAKIETDLPDEAVEALQESVTPVLDKGRTLFTSLLEQVAEAEETRGEDPRVKQLKHINAADMYGKVGDVDVLVYSHNAETTEMTLVHKRQHMSLVASGDDTILVKYPIERVVRQGEGTDIYSICAVESDTSGVLSFQNEVGPFNDTWQTNEGGVTYMHSGGSYSVPTTNAGMAATAFQEASAVIDSFMNQTGVRPLQ